MKRPARPGQLLLLAAALSVTLLHAQQASSGPWVMESSGTTAGLRGIHAVGGGVAWASGTNGTVVRTEDGGYAWQRCATPSSAEKLDFRGIWAWDANTAMVMSSGPGEQSRIYKTTDGCAHWKLLFTNPDTDGFWDAMVFRNRTKGNLLGDPVQGRFIFLNTHDGGKTWKRSSAEGLKAGAGATGAFAASNSSLLAGLRAPVLFGTVGGYIYAQSYQGTVDFLARPGTPIKMKEQWRRTLTPLHAPGNSMGIFSVGYHEGSVPGYSYTLIAVGGDYTKPAESTGTAAWSSDSQHWTAAAKPPHGFRSAVAWDAAAKAWITAGTNGSDISYDDGKTWAPLDNGNWNALSLPWAVGPHGRIAKLDTRKLPKK
ncbi:MAG: glycosyl hydrolase [Acidobacteriaceae bacterium]